MRWSLTIPAVAASVLGALAWIHPAQGTITRTLGERVTRVARARTLAGGRLIEGPCPRRYPRCISFTFDDGPEWSTTPRLLDMLDARQIHATFFVVGHRIAGDQPHHRLNREVLRDIARRGHRIGNHTFHHVLLDGLRPERIDAEIDDTAALITQVTHRRPWLLRAPFGSLDTQRSLKAVFSRRYTPTYWQIDTQDWNVRTPRDVLLNFRRALNESPQGGVVLMHDTRSWSVSAFPLVLNEIDRRNAQLVARGEAPYRIIGLDGFWQPVGPGYTPRGLPQPRRRSGRSGLRPARR